MLDRTCGYNGLAIEGIIFEVHRMLPVPLADGMCPVRNVVPKYNKGASSAHFE